LNKRIYLALDEYPFRMKIIFTFLSILYCFQFAGAQCGERYKEDIAASTILHADIVYGSNLDSRDQHTDLRMDIYEPEGDTSGMLRPVIIFSHGGSFVGGSRSEQGIDENAQFFAKKGYVSANIEYRLDQNVFISPFLNFLDANNWYKAVIRAKHDIRAAIRFLKKEVAENGNPYNIDTNLIFLYGSSAGAIASLHVAFLDNMDEASDMFRKNIEALGGGIEGNSGHSEYTSVNSVKGIINCSGVIEDTAYLNNNTEVAYMGFHHRFDLIPLDVGCIDVIFCHLGTYHGSRKIYEKAASLGMKSDLHIFDKYGHPADAYKETADRSLLLKKTTDFLYEILCTATPTPVSVNKSRSFKIYPNPATNVISIESTTELLQQVCTLEIMDNSGKVLQRHTFTATDKNDFSVDLPGGVYIARIIPERYTGTPHYISRFSIIR